MYRFFFYSSFIAEFQTENRLLDVNSKFLTILNILLHVILWRPNHTSFDFNETTLIDFTESWLRLRLNYRHVIESITSILIQFSIFFMVFYFSAAMHAVLLCLVICRVLQSLAVAFRETLVELTLKVKISYTFLNCKFCWWSCCRCYVLWKRNLEDGFVALVAWAPLAEVPEVNSSVACRGLWSLIFSGSVTESKSGI